MLDFDDIAFDESTEEELEERDARGRLEGDRKLRVKFYNKAVKNLLRTEEEGRPMFDQEVFIRIESDEDRGNSINDFARADHKKRFPKDWEAFQNQAAMDMSGTPVEHWKALSIDRVAELKALRLHTVEAIADLSDNAAGKVTGLTKLRNDAQVYLEITRADAVASKSAESSKKIAELQATNDAMAAKQKFLEEQVAQLMALAGSNKKKGD